MRKLTGITGALALSALSANAAIVAGDVIGFDFGNNGVSSTTANWNELTDAPNNTVATVNDPMRLSDGAPVTGVTFTFDFTVGNSGSNNGAQTGASIGFPDNVQNDNFFENNAEQWELKFTGLDPSLTYILTVGSYWPVGSSATQDENRNTGWQVGATQLVALATDADDSYVTFTGITPTGTGGDEIVLTTWDYNSNPVSTISALTLTAVPEPSSTALLGLGALGLLARRRRH
ncbi:MAG: PEP-CTERM sorting domain-containing protein [Verrucomicrobiales bacterium]